MLSHGRKGALPAIRARARQAFEAREEHLGRSLMLEANRLSRARPKVAEPRNRVMLATSLAGPIAALRDLSAEAAAVRRKLDQRAQAFAEAQRPIDIFRRLAGIFGLQTRADPTMKRIVSGIAGSAVCLVALIAVPCAGYAALPGRTEPSPLQVPQFAALFLSVMTPFSIIAWLFDMETTGGSIQIHCFEFVRGICLVDLPSSEATPSIADIPRFPPLLHADWMPLFCAIPCMESAGAGFARASFSSAERATASLGRRPPSTHIISTS